MFPNIRCFSCGGSIGGGIHEVYNYIIEITRKQAAEDGKTPEEAEAILEKKRLATFEALHIRLGCCRKSIVTPENFKDWQQTIMPQLPSNA